MCSRRYYGSQFKSKTLNGNQMPFDAIQRLSYIVCLKITPNCPPSQRCFLLRQKTSSCPTSNILLIMFRAPTSDLCVNIAVRRLPSNGPRVAKQLIQCSVYKVEDHSSLDDGLRFVIALNQEARANVRSGPRRALVEERRVDTRGQWGDCAVVQRAVVAPAQFGHCNLPTPRRPRVGRLAQGCVRTIGPSGAILQIALSYSYVNTDEPPTAAT